MSAGAIIFMAVSWGFVIGLASWSYARILKLQKHFDPDGIGPGTPPVPPAVDTRPNGPPGRND